MNVYPSNGKKNKTNTNQRNRCYGVRSLKNFTLHDCKRAWSDIPGCTLSVGGILCLQRNHSVERGASEQLLLQGFIYWNWSPPACRHAFHSAPAWHRVGSVLGLGSSQETPLTQTLVLFCFFVWAGGWCFCVCEHSDSEDSEIGLLGFQRREMLEIKQASVGSRTPLQQFK